MTDGMYALLGQLDLFAFWSCALVAIGLMQVAKLEKSKAITAAVILARARVPADDLSGCDGQAGR